MTAPTQAVVALDIRTAMELLHQVVGEYGANYRYTAQAATEDVPVCRYERDGAPSCLVGHVLARAGASVEQLAELDLIPIPIIGSTEVAEVQWLHLTPGARMVLDAAQGRQDVGETWGAALAAAEQAGAMRSACDGICQRCQRPWNSCTCPEQ